MCVLRASREEKVKEELVQRGANKSRNLTHGRRHIHKNKNKYQREDKAHDAQYIVTGKCEVHDDNIKRAADRLEDDQLDPPREHTWCE